MQELLANFFPPAGGPALVPLNDPMVLVNGQQSLQKVNLYRDGTGQPQADNNNASGLTYWYVHMDYRAASSDQRPLAANKLLNQASSSTTTSSCLRMLVRPLPAWRTTCSLSLP
jgi:hypothetical protein